ncbi:hypothetical protein LPC08_19195 [Roseomonas sp. OT10]|uniref:hypothetical protein n=1 Tax=Roseomonas cutis TaxID=2897332 RepID=UPI001E2F82AA|nr:hypothetical protein [Roseomonas sp. OT10]UFN48121.1 hypothetical protein LPC08_19195 [Roseomonas sp. OT10]
MTGAETVPVRYEVKALEPVRGAGRLVGLALVEVEVAGVILTLQGVQVLHGGGGGLTCRAPCFRHPRDGRGLPAVVLPAALADAIAAEVLELAAQEIARS